MTVTPASTARRLPAWAYAMSVIVLAAWAAMVLIPMSHRIPEQSAAWVVMVVAMMVPTVARPMIRISRGEGTRAGAFMLGYVAIWMLSIPIAIVAMSAQFWNASSVLILWIAVGAYQLLPSTMSHLRRCRSLDASATPAMLGVRQGIACTIACLPMMLAVMLSVMQWGLSAVPAAALLIAASAFMIWEKSPSVTRSMIRASGIAIILAAVVLFTVGLGAGSSGHVHDSAGQASGVSRS